MATSAEQAVSLTDVEQSMKRVDDVTRRNAEAAHNFAATAEELSAQATRLEELVGQFRLAQSEAPAVAPLLVPASLSVTPAERDRSRRLTQRLSALEE